MVSGKLKPSNFIGKVEFGTVKSVDNKNTGRKTQVFVPTTKQLRFAPRSRSTTQSDSIFGTDIQETKIIAVRHNESVTDNLKVRFIKTGKVHDIKYVSSDESNGPIAFDYVTITKEPSGAFDGT
ncbi:head-tail joining protein [Leuconostoc kimchii IMSNU 11154]|uniref:Head-tail joining protein n=1 Tax=Leuconostoc kimchii (strain IMSNU 11154 / KCTC 2386 / IH25) TaxID=762051 RepID=D5T0U9_LEUKI|nr:phage head closure protein [Leuconostoc kimchii]ADG39898.1 head-tail joining protein [Leuconostoc kimchii IMSNU 11154]